MCATNVIHIDILYTGFIQEAAHQIREHLRVFEDYFREHLHDNISTVTFCNANNKAFVSNSGPSNFPMFVTFTKT